MKMLTKKIITFGFAISVFFLSIPCESFAKNKEITGEETKYDYINIEAWKKLNDPYLTEYIIIALQNNHDLKISTLKTEETKQKKNIQRAEEMPQIGIGAIPALYKLPYLTKSEGLISLPAFAHYELDLFGKNRDKTKALDKALEISRQNEKAAYISVTSAVAGSYYNIIKLDKLIELQEQIVLDRKKINELMKLSNDEGLVSASDTANANKAYIKSEADLIELKKSKERLLNMFCVLIAESPDNSSEIKRLSYDEVEFEKNIPDAVSSDVIFSRPDYIAAEKLLEKSGFDVRAAKKEFLPSFDIFGFLSFNSTKYLASMNWKNATAFIGAGAFMSLFSGGRKIANLKLKKNIYEQSFENYKKTALVSLQEVNDSLYNLKLDDEKYLKTLEIYNTEKKDYELNELKYKEGILSLLDILQKRENLLSAEKKTVNERIDLYTDFIELYKVTGGVQF